MKISEVMTAIIVIFLSILLAANLLRGIAQAGATQDAIMEEERKARNN